MDVKVFEFLRARSLKIGMVYRFTGSNVLFEVLNVLEHAPSPFPNFDGLFTVFNTDGTDRVFTPDCHVEILTGGL